MSWQKAISKSERGESGRVYFINAMCILKDGEEWTKNTPFTLNPEHGQTIEEMLKKSKDIPKPMKADLLEKRYTEQVLTSGLVLKFWISEEPAPDWWAPTEEQKLAKRRAEGKPLLFDSTGNALR